MSSRFFLWIAVVLFGGIGLAALVKNRAEQSQAGELPIIEEVVVETGGLAPVVEEPVEAAATERVLRALPSPAEGAPQGNHVEKLFKAGTPRFPFVKTITYSSRVPWKKGRFAWIADYAKHFKTSRFFIARSLHGKPDYFNQDIFNGDRFNIYDPEINLSFYIAIDIARSILWLYAYDEDTDTRYFIRDYPVGLGRLDPHAASGSLTPLGKYSLGSRTTIHRPGVMGIYKGEKTELIRIFGTRWIPFDKELANCTEPAAGYGIHGVPWVKDATGRLIEDTSSLQAYEGDGCVRMQAKDVEELYAIILSRKAIVELVPDFKMAHLPGNEIN